MVLVDGIALKRGYVSTGERCEIIGVGPVDIDWVKQLLPDAIVHALVHDGVDITTYASPSETDRAVSAHRRSGRRRARCAAKRSAASMAARPVDRTRFAPADTGPGSTTT